MNTFNTKDTSNMVLMSEVKLATPDTFKSPANNLHLNIDKDDKLECWTELKVKDRFIDKRSYHASCVYNSTLYVYGGQDLNVGIYEDFNSVQLNEEFVLSCWETVTTKTKVSPGPLSRMSHCLDGDKWYFFGGTTSATTNINDLWCFDFTKNEWTLIKPATTSRPPCLDSHSGCLYKTPQGKTSLIVFGGFVGGAKGEYWNQVVKFDLDTKKWTLPYSDNAVEFFNPVGPAPRCGHTAIVYYNDMYMFGGTNGELRFNDLWKYNLLQDSWQKINASNCPPPRNGHTSVIYKNQGIVIFGGIQDITHERDDLIYYDLNNGVWETLDAEKEYHSKLPSSRSPDKSPDDKFSKERMLGDNFRRGQTMKDSRRSTKGFDQTSPSKRGFSPDASVKEGGFGKFNKSHTNNSFAGSQSEMRTSMSPNSKPYQGLSKENEEKRKKLFLARKTNFLKQFEIVDPNEAMTMIVKSPTTEAMKNSIIAINYKANQETESPMQQSPMQQSPTKLSQSCSPTKTKKKGQQQTNLFHDLLGDTAIRVRVPINGKLNGRKPCARDGHSSVTVGNKMIVFGGDRHKMCFNDVYVLDMKQMIQPNDKGTL